jgi:hypothetical protein
VAFSGSKDEEVTSQVGDVVETYAKNTIVKKLSGRK